MLVTTALPASFFHAERVIYAVLALVVGVVAAVGALALSDSRVTEEPQPAMA